MLILRCIKCQATRGVGNRQNEMASHLGHTVRKCNHVKATAYFLSRAGESNHLLDALVPVLISFGVDSDVALPNGRIHLPAQAFGMIGKSWLLGSFTPNG